MEFDELDIGLAIRHPEKGKRCFHVSEPDHPIQPRPFQRSFPLQFKPEVEKERFRGSKITDDDTHVIYLVDLHISYLLLLLFYGGEKRTETVNTIWKFHQGSSVSIGNFLLLC